MNTFITFISSYIDKLEDSLIEDYLNNINKETSEEFTGLFYLGKEYTCISLLIKNKYKGKYLSYNYINYINDFHSVKVSIDNLKTKEAFIKNALYKIMLRSREKYTFIDLFPSSWIQEIYKKKISGSDRYKEFLSKEEEHVFTETVTYLLGMRIVMND